MSDTKKGRKPGKSGTAASRKRAKPPPEAIEALRMSAMSIFTRTRAPITLEQMADMPAFRLVPKAMLRAWADEDNWAGARNYELALLRQAIQRHASGELVRHKRQQLMVISEIQDQAMQILRDELCAPTSWNDTARVAFKAQEIAAEITQGMVGDVADGATADDQRSLPPHMPDGGVLPPAVNRAAQSKVSDEEAAVGAHAIITWRRNKLLEQMAAASPSDPPNVQSPTPTQQEPGPGSGEEPK